MRARFFWITFFVLFFVSLMLVGLHGLFLREERIRLIDQGVRAAAEALLDSELTGLRRVQYERVDEIISEELGETQIGKFFVIRDGQDNVLYESSSAQVLPLLGLPRTPQWVTVEEKGQFIRVLNLDLPRINNRTMQVGVVLDSGLVSLFPPLRAALAFVAASLLIGLVAAGLLTSFLLRPISNLYLFIARLGEGSLAGPLPSLPLGRRDLTSRDEMASLRRGISRLIERVNRGYRTSRAWSFQMAHELKTPLAIIEAEVSAAEKKGAVAPEVAQAVRAELGQASSAVTAFLSWAELESAPPAGSLYAHRLSAVVRETKERLEKQFPDRLQESGDPGFTVLAAPQHLELVLLNLMKNALLYSEGPVRVIASRKGTVEIQDAGPGIPPGVQERLGEPFNKGGATPGGHGLGLALVSGICRHYGWKLSFTPLAPGTCARISFPMP